MLFLEKTRIHLASVFLTKPPPPAKTPNKHRSLRKGHKQGSAAGHKCFCFDSHLLNLYYTKHSSLCKSLSEAECRLRAVFHGSRPSISHDNCTSSIAALLPFSPQDKYVTSIKQGKLTHLNGFIIVHIR